VDADSSPLAPIARCLLGITVTRLWHLSAVSDDGVIPLPGQLVLGTDIGFVTLSYTQEGLSCRRRGRRSDVRWDTEPDLAMGRSENAEEWLELTPLEEHTHVPELPLLVEAVTGWFGTGRYLDTLALILAGGGRELVIMTTDDFDLRCTTRQVARERAELVAANMNLRLIEEESRRAV
jgi:hypothetical protein